jgi:hypothetical protein
MFLCQAVFKTDDGIFESLLESVEFINLIVDCQYVQITYPTCVLVDASKQLGNLDFDIPDVLMSKRITNWNV